MSLIFEYLQYFNIPIAVYLSRFINIFIIHWCCFDSNENLSISLTSIRSIKFISYRKLRWLFSLDLWNCTSSTWLVFNFRFNHFLNFQLSSFLTFQKVQFSLGFDAYEFCSDSLKKELQVGRHIWANRLERDAGEAKLLQIVEILNCDSRWWLSLSSIFIPSFVPFTIHPMIFHTEFLMILKEFLIILEEFLFFCFLPFIHFSCKKRRPKG